MGAPKVKKGFKSTGPNCAARSAMQGAELYAESSRWRSPGGSQAVAATGLVRAARKKKASTMAGLHCLAIRTETVSVRLPGLCWV